MASAESLDKKMIAQLREQFKKNYIDLPSDELAKFDERDVNRIFNDDLFALSFIHWKKEVIKDAVGLVAQTLDWRKQNNVADISVESIGEEFIERGVCYVYGRGIDGTRVFTLVARLQTKDEKDKMRKVFLFWLERLQRNEPGQHVTFILDTHKTAMSNVDLGMIRFIIDSFTIFFPDLLEKIIVLDMPWIMNAIWSIVKQWMSEEQRSKIFFCSRKDLHKFVAADQRPISMAGTVDWTFRFPPFPDDMSQDHHFLNDPMNFKRKSGVIQENGDMRPASDDQFNNNKAANRSLRRRNSRGRNSPVSTEQFDTEATSATDSTLVRTPTKSRTSSRRTSSPISSGMHKASSFAFSRSSSRDEETKLKRHHTTGNIYQSDDKNQSNAPSQSTLPHDAAKLKIHYTTDNIQHSDNQKPSFQSITSYDEIGGISRHGSDGKMRMDTKFEEIALGNLLFMSPVSELVFTLEGERLEGHINIRNPNPVTAEDRDKVYVAFKVKTTSPERYHVKPSVGVISPGDDVHIRIHISSGHEALMVKDRFLLLYKPIPVEEDNFPSHSEIAKFWKKNSDKSLHFEHRVHVAVDESGLKAPKTDVRKSKEDDFNSRVYAPKDSSQYSGHGSTLGLSSITSRPSLAQEPSPGPSFVEYAQLNQRVSLLNNKITRIESDTRWMRRRMRHTMGLLFVVLILMLFIIYEILVMSYGFPNSNQSTRKQDL